MRHSLTELEWQASTFDMETRQRGKSVWLNALDVFATDYSVLEHMTLQQVYEGSRAGGKTQRMKELMDRAQKGAQQRFLRSQPKPVFVASYSRREFRAVTWNEMGLVPGKPIGDDTIEALTGIANRELLAYGNIGIDRNGFKVVCGVSETVIEFERIGSYGASRQTDDLQRSRGLRGNRLRTSTVGPFAGRRILRLHQWGSNLQQLLCGIRAIVTEGSTVGDYNRDGSPRADRRSIVFAGRRWSLA